MMNLAPILPQVISTAKKAGDFIRKQGINFNYEQAEVKGLNDLVSYVDKASEQMIVARLRQIIPGAGFIVEENTASGKEEFNWIVDPLDGTTNFIHGIPCHAVSIALEHNGKVILGVVYEVGRDECFHAVQGGGAFMNNKPVRVSKRPTLGESLIGTGFPIYNFTRMNEFLAALKYMMQHSHGVRRIGAAAADLCYLAAGRLDGFFEYNLNAWDVAAGALIVKEAGGSVSDFSGGDDWLFGKEICCTNGLIREEFNKIMKVHFKDNAQDQ
jgi:myo-inositol-1(or 4)-monophosphatase